MVPFRQDWESLLHSRPNRRYIVQINMPLVCKHYSLWISRIIGLLAYCYRDPKQVWAFWYQYGYYRLIFPLLVCNKTIGQITRNNNKADVQYTSDSHSSDVLLRFLSFLSCLVMTPDAR